MTIDELREIIAELRGDMDVTRMERADENRIVEIEIHEIVRVRARIGRGYTITSLSGKDVLLLD